MISLQYQAPHNVLTPFVSSFYLFEYQGDMQKNWSGLTVHSFAFFCMARDNISLLTAQDASCFP